MSSAHLSQAWAGCWLAPALAAAGGNQLRLATHRALVLRVWGVGCVPGVCAPWQKGAALLRLALEGSSECSNVASPSS